MKRSGYLVGVLVLAGCLPPLSAATVAIGQIVLQGFSPNSGNQTLAVYNYTGDANCDPVNAGYEVCGGAGINITDWTLSVLYTDNVDPFSHTATFGPNSTDPIGPFDPSVGSPFTGTPGSQWTFDQTCDFICPPFVTNITSATFSGSISSTNLTLSTVVGGGTFFAAPTFTVTYTPTLLFSDGSSYAIYSSADILVNDNGGGGGGGVPEPSSLSLVLLGAGAAGVSRLVRRRNTSYLRP